MIEDIREALEDGAETEFDLVVIGAGPAGISLARALDGSGLKIALLEAGGMEHPDGDAQALYNGETVGLPYPLAASRQRFFGGTSNHWGGWCRPLDDSDFATRQWVPMSGWPIDRASLDPWYGRAHELLEIASDDYDAARHAGEEAILPADEASGFRNAGFRFSPPVRFRPAFADELRASEDIHVFLHATVTGFEHDGGRVAAVRVGTLSGGDYTIRGGRFVLAAGGIEVARLLLHTASAEREALGNGSGYLGRCFMEHFGYTPGYLLTRARLKYYRHDDGDGVPFMPVLAPRPRLMEAEGLNNFCLLLNAVEPDTAWPPQALATPGLARGIDDAWRYRVTMINEPSPNPESRVMLSDERDALGMRRLVLDWRIRERDLESIERIVSRLSQWLGGAGLGRVQFSRPISEETTSSFSGGMHHMGTTRMSASADDGVVDPDCRVHGTENLYVASSSVFPAAGYSNPTLTIVALALRLADHLRGGAA